MSERVTHTDYDDADLIRTCTRKKGYPSEAVALLAVGAIRRVNPAAGVRPYGCRRCGQWHVGGGAPSGPLVGDAPPPEQIEHDDDDGHRIRRRAANRRLDHPNGYIRGRRRRRGA